MAVVLAPTRLIGVVRTVGEAVAAEVEAEAAAVRAGKLVGGAHRHCNSREVGRFNF